MKVIVFAGTQAGVGKTTVAVGVMAALRQRGLRVQGFKVGPDLTDPLLHEAATGRPSYNLDGWMLSKEYNLGRVRRASIDADVAIVEGAEGLFDGVEGDERGSTGEIAKWLGAPVILVLDCASLRPRSAAAVLKGCLAFDDEVVVAGVVLNNTKNDAHAKIIRDAITAADLGVEVYGAVRTLESADGATNFLTTGRGGVSGASSVDRRRQLAIVANKALMAGGGTSLGQSQVVAGGNEDGGASTKERGRSGGRDAAGKGGGGEKGDNRARGSGKASGDAGGHADHRSSLDGSNRSSLDGEEFVTGIAAHLADAVGAGVDLSALLAAAGDFVGDGDGDDDDENDDADPGVADPGDAEGAATSPPMSPSRNSENFGGRDMNKFPAIPESPKRAPATPKRGGGVDGSPNARKTPKKNNPLGRIGHALGHLRGVGGNAASHLIPRTFSGGGGGVRIGVARDAAFCHYYRENLALLEAAGAELVAFSPLAGDSLPTGCKGILFGGGYPEQHANALASNRPLRMAITAFAAGGGVIYGECGGLVFLSQSLTPLEGSTPRPMCGLAPFSTRGVATEHSGYATVTIRQGCPLFPAGAKVRGQVCRNSEIASEPNLSRDGAGAGGGWFAAYDVRPGGNFNDSGSDGEREATERGGGDDDDDSSETGTPADSRRRKSLEGSWDDVRGEMVWEVKSPSPTGKSWSESSLVSRGGSSSSLAGKDGGGWQSIGRVEGYAWRNVLMSYARLHFGDDPRLARHFVEKCKQVPAAAAEAALKAAAAARNLSVSASSSMGSVGGGGFGSRQKSVGALSQLGEGGSSAGILDGVADSVWSTLDGDGDSPGRGGSGGGGALGNSNGNSAGSGLGGDSGGREKKSFRSSEPVTMPSHRRTQSEDTPDASRGGKTDRDRDGNRDRDRDGNDRALALSTSNGKTMLHSQSTGHLSSIVNGGVRRSASGSDLDLEALLSFPPAGGGGFGAAHSHSGGVGFGFDDVDGRGGLDGIGHLHSPASVPQPTPSRTCTIASLTPAATEIVHALGLQSRLVCVTDRCNFPQTVERKYPIVLRSRSVISPNGEIGRPSRLNPNHRQQSIGSAMLEAAGARPGGGTRGEGEYVGVSVDVEWLRRARPGLVLTQDACERCGKGAGALGGGGGESVVARALSMAGVLRDRDRDDDGDGRGDDGDGRGGGGGGSRGGGGTRVLAMDPQRLSEVMDVIVQVGAATGVEEIAVALVDSLRARLRAVAAAVSSAEKRPRVLSLEGLRPLAVGGHWLPEMKSLAGGSDELQEPGAPAVGLRWEQVLAYAPEVLILSPCVSPSPHQTLAELDRLASNPGFWAIPAVKNRRVYVVHHVLFSRAGPRLVNGVELLAKILHPSLAPDVAVREGGTVLKMTMEPGRQCRPRQLRQFFTPWGGAGATGEEFSKITDAPTPT